MTHSNNAIQEQVRNILADRCQISIDSENSEQKIHLDSMALMELIVGLENTFDIKLESDSLEHFYRFPSLDGITQLVIGKAAIHESKEL